MKKKEQKSEKDQNVEVEEISIQHNVEMEELKKHSKEYFELAQRTMADFDNYKKRTVREKEMLYADAVNNIIVKILPVLDSLETALKQINNEENKSVVEGIELVVRQFKETLRSVGVEEIKAIGEKFNPQYHYAVSHVNDSSFGENDIIEDMQRGYIINDRVIRHSMVKVAN